MSATDELRAELTKRGVEWNGKESTDVGNMTEWECGKTKAVAMEEDDGTLGLGATHLTPAQAIAATLGRRTCHKVRVHMQIEDEMHCSECGRFLGFAGDAGAPPYYFCPKCGAEVVDE